MTTKEKEIADKILGEIDLSTNTATREQLIAQYDYFLSAAYRRSVTETPPDPRGASCATGIGTATAPRATIGRIVHYTLSEEDREEITRRRTTGASIAERIKEGQWPIGAQAHIGNSVGSSEVYPAMVVREWDGDMVNLRVFLDGSDEYWATSRHMEDPDGPRNQPGTWHWPTRG